jgi:hypothetical protein
MKNAIAVAVLLAGTSMMASPAFASCNDALRDLQNGPRLTDKAADEAREAQYQLKKGSESNCLQHARNAMAIMDQEARSGSDRRYSDRDNDRRYSDRDRRSNDPRDDEFSRRYDDQYRNGSSGSSRDNSSRDNSNNPLGSVLDALGGRR